MRKHIFISGRVQGVGFRHFTKVNARKRNINGWVKNLSDGRVEAVFEGEDDKVKEMVAECKHGPRSARVENIEEAEISSEESFSGFEVRH